jgi:glycosyltransferase involved in cell wall biosynthesis
VTDGPGAGTVTVVVPTHNRPALLEAAVRSVLLQTRPVDQILIVDDGSDPANADQVQAVAALSPTIELIHQSPATGVGSARNAGIERARGDFVLFLDDDDLIHPRLVEDGVARLAGRPDAGAVVFLYECIFTPSNLGSHYPAALLFDYQRLPVHPLRVADGGNPVPFATLERRPVTAFLRYLIPVHSCLVRRSAIGRQRFLPALKQGEDTHFWISLAAAGCRFLFDERVYAFVRRHHQNTTHSKARYVREIQACYERLLADGLLTAPDDAFLAHLKLLWFKTLSHRPGRARHLAHILAAPDQLLRETIFWLGNLRARQGLLRYYLSW